jgi:hypothetical protein
MLLGCFMMDNMTFTITAGFALQKSAAHDENVKKTLQGISVTMLQCYLALCRDYPLTGYKSSYIIRAYTRDE